MSNKIVDIFDIIVVNNNKMKKQINEIMGELRKNEYNYHLDGHYVR